MMDNGFRGQEGQKVPEMTPEVVSHIEDRYIELYEKITGSKFEKREYSAEGICKNVTEYLKSLI